MGASASLTPVQALGLQPLCSEQEETTKQIWSPFWAPAACEQRPSSCDLSRRSSGSSCAWRGQSASLRPRRGVGGAPNGRMARRNRCLFGETPKKWFQQSFFAWWTVKKNLLKRYPQQHGTVGVFGTGPMHPSNPSSEPYPRPQMGKDPTAFSCWENLERVPSKKCNPQRHNQLSATGVYPICKESKGRLLLVGMEAYKQPFEGRSWPDNP